MNLYHGDCLEIMKAFPPDYYSALVTDPPAGISFMGKDWDHNANLVLDEEAAEMLDEQSGISISRAGVRKNSYKNGNAMYDGIPKDVMVNYHDFGGASRFFYVAKASKSDRGSDNKHPTVKSTKLMEYLIKLVTPPGGMVLDPFMGSGSTGKACKKLGISFVGIKKDIDYFAIAEKRCV